MDGVEQARAGWVVGPRGGAGREWSCCGVPRAREDVQGAHPHTEHAVLGLRGVRRARMPALPGGTAGRRGQVIGWLVGFAT